jgi:hypothetical protein
MRGSVPGLLLDVVAVALFGVYLVAAVPLAIRRAVNMLRTEAEVAAGESLTDARARCFGDSYTRAIDEIRRAIPADRAYLLVDGGRPQDGDTYWVRYDLAPRPAISAGQLATLDAARLRRVLGLRDLRQVVVAYAPGVPPRLYDLASFLGDLARRPGAAAAPDRANPDQRGAPRPATPGAAAGHAR